MYIVAVVHRLQTTRHIIGNVEQQSLLVNTVKITAVTAQIRLQVSLQYDTIQYNYCCN